MERFFFPPQSIQICFHGTWLGKIKLFSVSYAVAQILWVFGNPNTLGFQCREMLSAPLGAVLLELLGESCAAVFSSSRGQWISAFILEDVLAQSAVAGLCRGLGWSCPTAYGETAASSTNPEQLHPACGGSGQQAGKSSLLLAQLGLAAALETATKPFKRGFMPWRRAHGWESFWHTRWPQNKIIWGCFGSARCKSCAWWRCNQSCGWKLLCSCRVWELRGRPQLDMKLGFCSEYLPSTTLPSSS